MLRPKPTHVFRRRSRRAQKYRLTVMKNANITAARTFPAVSPEGETVTWFVPSGDKQLVNSWDDCFSNSRQWSTVFTPWGLILNWGALHFAPSSHKCCTYKATVLSDNYVLKQRTYCRVNIRWSPINRYFIESLIKKCWKLESLDIECSSITSVWTTANLKKFYKKTLLKCADPHFFLKLILIIFRNVSLQ